MDNQFDNMDNIIGNTVIAFRYERLLEERGIYEISLPQYLEHLKQLNPSKIICATPIDDPSIEILNRYGIDVKTYENYRQDIYTKVIEDFYHSAEGKKLLILSFGIYIHRWQIDHAYHFLKSRNLLTVGWRILHQENDGSYLGKLSYNTCMLHNKKFYKYVDEVGGIPEYVKNGYLGSIKLSTPEGENEIEIGGQEDLALQLKLYKRYKGKKNKLFGHITHYGIDSKEKISQTPFTSKIARKVITAEIYRRREEVSSKDFMNCWQIV